METKEVKSWTGCVSVIIHTHSILKRNVEAVWHCASSSKESGADFLGKRSGWILHLPHDVMDLSSWFNPLS